MDAPVARGTVSGPEVHSSTRRFEARLRLYAVLLRVVRGIDGSDVLTVLALAGVFIGLAAPSAAFLVTGALLMLLTPVGTALRILIRGR